MPRRPPMTGRRLIALLCIAIVIVAAMTPTAAHLVADSLRPLGPLFGTIVSAAIFAADTSSPKPAPALSVRVSRAPPVS